MATGSQAQPESIRHSLATIDSAWRGARLTLARAPRASLVHQLALLSVSCPPRALAMLVRNLAPHGRPGSSFFLQVRPPAAPVLRASRLSPASSARGGPGGLLVGAGASASTLCGRELHPELGVRSNVRERDATLAGVPPGAGSRLEPDPPLRAEPFVGLSAFDFISSPARGLLTSAAAPRWALLSMRPREWPTGGAVAVAPPVHLIPFNSACSRPVVACRQAPSPAWARALPPSWRAPRGARNSFGLSPQGTAGAVAVLFAGLHACAGESWQPCAMLTSAPAQRGCAEYSQPQQHPVGCMLSAAAAPFWVLLLI